MCATGVPLGRVPAGIWSLRGRVEPTSPVPPCCQRVVCGGRAALAILFSAQRWRVLNLGVRPPGNSSARSRGGQMRHGIVGMGWDGRAKLALEWL